LLEFLGRNDAQVKIRGFRIELGEIEAVLLQPPFVAQAAVAALPAPSGELRLVGFLVWRQPQPPDAMQQLQQHLRRSLPDYMVPALLLELAALPLTPNGKLDRKALAALQPSPEQQPHDFVAPRSPVEEVLANIWAQVLQRERVGIHDNFFQLGGHSLLATQALWRIRSAFRIELPLRALFESPTVSVLATRIENDLIEQTDANEIEHLLQEVQAMAEDDIESLLAEHAKPSANAKAIV
jgi:acyl carrier protein